MVISKRWRGILVIVAIMSLLGVLGVIAPGTHTCSELTYTPCNIATTGTISGGSITANNFWLGSPGNILTITNNQYAVQAYSSHPSGYGLYAQGYTGVWGQSNQPTGWAGYFERGNVYVANNLGIGTTTPSSKLHLVQDINGNVQTILTLSAQPDQILTLESPSDGGLAEITSSYDLSLQTASNRYLKFMDGGTEVMRLTGGKVGIGTNAPQGNLHIVARPTEGASIFLDADASHSADIIFKRAGILSYALYRRNDNKLTIYNYNNPNVSLRYAFTVDSEGRVGVSTINPKSTLDVTGGALVRGNLNIIGPASIAENLDVTGTVKTSAVIMKANNTDDICTITVRSNIPAASPGPLIGSGTVEAKCFRASTSPGVQFCGDGIVTAPEVCDPPGSYKTYDSCEQGGESGSLKGFCNSDCLGYNTPRCICYESCRKLTSTDYATFAYDCGTVFVPPPQFPICNP